MHARQIKQIRAQQKNKRYTLNHRKLASLNRPIMEEERKKKAYDTNLHPNRRNQKLEGGKQVHRTKCRGNVKLSGVLVLALQGVYSNNFRRIGRKRCKIVSASQKPNDSKALQAFQIISSPNPMSLWYSSYSALPTIPTKDTCGGLCTATTLSSQIVSSSKSALFSPPHTLHLFLRFSSALNPVLPALIGGIMKPPIPSNPT